MEASFVCSYWMHMVAATSPRGKTGGTSPARPRNGTTGYAAMAGTAGACVPHAPRRSWTRWAARTCPSAAMQPMSGTSLALTCLSTNP
ncbi:unnamed protein product, partial [Effrenium voratum]